MCDQRMLDPTATGLHLGETPLLQTVGVTKRYGDFLANEAIDIDIWPQQIHALLGENGAGKSTLVKTIYGLIQPSEGEMLWQGEKMVLSGPSEARGRGIGMVFQHFSLFDNFTVAENVALGLDGKESFKDMSARLEEVSNVYGLPLDPRREVWQLSVGERQRIEIVWTRMQNPKFLILDEPTAVLTPQEADQLFVVLDRLKAEGRAILYISHKLEEVKRLCDMATILRGGKKISTCNPQLETAASLARMMVGADIKEVRAAAGRQTTVPRLVVNDLSLEPDDPHGVRLEHIALELKGGEILGIAGVAGNGQDELFAALSGERLAQDPGTVVIDGQAAGHGSINTAATLSTVDRATQAFDVRKAKRDPEAASLSGGNLQKFIVGREILRNPAVLVVNQPTWGVDAGAAAVIRQALLDLAAGGAAVLVTSQDLDELTEITDRIAVIFHGRRSEPMATADANREKLGLLMGGSSLDQKEPAHAVGALKASRAIKHDRAGFAADRDRFDDRDHEHFVCDPRQESDLRAWRLFHRSLDRQLFAAGNCGEGDTAVDDRDRVVALLSRQRLEHRSRRTVFGRCRRRQLARRENAGHRRRTLGDARDVAARRGGGGALCPDTGDLQGPVWRQRDSYQPDAGVCGGPFSRLSRARSLARSGRVQFPDHRGVRSGRNRAGSD